MPNLLSRLGKSAFLVLAAFGCTYMLWPHMHPLSLGTFYAAVAIASWRYGRLEGLFATALSVILIDYNFIPPLHSVKIGKEGLVFLAEFVAIAIAVSYVGSSRRRALLAAEREAERLRSSQQDLLVSEERWRVLAETVPNLIWTCRADGAVEYVSPQWREYTGESPTRQVGYRWLLSIHPQDRDDVCARWESATKANAPFEVVCRIRSAQNTYHWFKMRAVPATDSNPVHWIGACTDIDDVQNTSVPPTSAPKAVSN